MIVGCCCNAGEVEAVIALFEQIAALEGWQSDGGLRSHQDRSVYFALTEAGRVGGGVQVVTPDSSGALPAHQVWPELPEAGAKCVHVAVLALAPEYRGRRTPSPLWLLGLELWRYCVTSGVSELWLEATPKMLRAYRFLGFPLVVQGEKRVHWGEVCFPCRMSVREVAGAIAERALRSSTYRDLLIDAVSCCTSLTPTVEETTMEETASSSYGLLSH